MRGVTSTGHMGWHRLGTDRLDIRPTKVTRGMAMEWSRVGHSLAVSAWSGFGMVLTTMEPVIRW